jgi:DNA invertase Pin-like site-specific DNA recombinase
MPYLILKKWKRASSYSRGMPACSFGEFPMTRPAIAYLRTSSSANVGADKDSDKRQRSSIGGYATQAGYEIVSEFYDAAVSGADPIGQRPGFCRLLAYAEEHRVTTIIVEGASRFARDLIVQETGYAMLTRSGFTLIAADDPDAFTAATPTAILIRQILGAVSQFEKANLVAKLRAARDRRKMATGKRIEGRKGYDDTRPDLVREAKRLARRSPTTGKARSLRNVSAELAGLGYTTRKGAVFSAAQVKRLLAYSVPRAANVPCSATGQLSVAEPIT